MTTKPGHDNTVAQINEIELAQVLQRYELILRPFTYQGTARKILWELNCRDYVLMARDDL